MTTLRSLEARVGKLEEDIKSIAQVLSATTDDTLRVCLVLQELSNGGYLPDLPWDLGSALVELQYARRAKEDGLEDRAIEIRVAELESKVEALRKAFRRRADEQLIE